jgi:hypothetical protein
VSDRNYPAIPGSCGHGSFGHGGGWQVDSSAFLLLFFPIGAAGAARPGAAECIHVIAQIVTARAARTMVPGSSRFTTLIVPGSSRFTNRPRP